MEAIDAVLGEVSGFVWGPFLLIPLLVGAGLYLTVMLRGLQFHKLGYALWYALIKRKEPGDGVEGDISHYQALATALAATVGVGNIAGVATAISIGGPGALFWMWVTGLVGMATKYSEAFLGVRYRRTDAKGEQSGGPMFYLTYGLKEVFPGWGAGLGTVLGIAFAVFGGIAAFGIGNMSQANSVADQLNSTFNVPFWLSGAVMMVLAGAVLLGGIKSIGRFAAGVVPFMIIAYILGGLAVIVLQIGNLPAALGQVFTDAFTGTAAAGGFVGSGILLAIQYGVARGVFSNESGLGTGGIAAAAAKTTNPVRQALVSMTQTFIDTLIVVTITGLVIVTTGVWTRTDDEGVLLTGAPLTAEGFSVGLPGTSGEMIVAIALVFFAFTTLVGWCYYGERCMDRLFGRVAVVPFRVVFVLVVFVGSVIPLNTVWLFSDIANGLMALPNLIGLVLLSGLVARETRAYFANPNWKLAGTTADPGNNAPVAGA
ncbi:alanine/glycine:cation symporter family protein [Allonocardiopsis opalescens]|uniref:AGCS family alanine or glycine:cation symporter n=1 Tax=Allonocardiopsis opalescens TaxID=1144618 RepID=A0A2T0PVR3_9ACTN|nr:sodium:alanine symporter family protein [Allonocardiopsis opalescens]PRX95448.1 AGCS family alanine or glycine:cation symporter [Allonocardiopsis opalescens]